MLSTYGTSFLANALVGQATLPATLYLALLTQQPNLADTGTLMAAYEPSGGSYARQSVAMTSSVWNAASSGVCTNKVAISFPVCTADWGYITHYAFCTAATAGEWLWGEALTSPGSILSGYQFYIPVNGVGITLVSA